MPILLLLLVALAAGLLIALAFDRLAPAKGATAAAADMVEGMVEDTVARTWLQRAPIPRVATGPRAHGRRRAS